VQADEFAFQQIEAPAGGDAALCEDHAVSAIRWDIDFGRDRE
jgi:hypothetical protein